MEVPNQFLKNTLAKSGLMNENFEYLTDRQPIIHRETSGTVSTTCTVQGTWYDVSGFTTSVTFDASNYITLAILTGRIDYNDASTFNYRITQSGSTSASSSTVSQYEPYAPTGKILPMYHTWLFTSTASGDTFKVQVAGAEAAGKIVRVVATSTLILLSYPND